MDRTRQLWIKAHRWLGLGCGWLLVLVGISGALLIVARPLDRLSHPGLFIAQPAMTAADPQPSTLPWTPAQLRTRFGEDARLTLRPPRSPEETLWVMVRSPAWNGTVYLNPASGDEQGRRGEYEGLLNLLFKFHSSLFLQDTGKAVLAGLALVCLGLLLSGIILWWPQHWRGVLKLFILERGRGLRRTLFDLHRLAGILCGTLIVISVATGAYMAWRPLAGWVTTLSGNKLTAAPSLNPSASPPREAVSVGELARRAQARFPDSMLGYIQLPASNAQPVRVRLRVADDPHPNGSTSIWLHPLSGEVLAVHRRDQLDPGTRAFSVVYPLHTGEIGGVLLELLTLIGGLALGLLGISGLWLWGWRRKRLPAGAA
jgi:uncharacterized iron-regulated membrane protein